VDALIVATSVTLVIGVVRENGDQYHKLIGTNPNVGLYFGIITEGNKCCC
jgi:hypothetical protein